MALIKTLKSSVNSVLADQWREYFYCDSIPENVLVTKGQKRVSGRSSNTKATDNIISNGSIIAVADGQCMMIVDQGGIAEFTAEPGEFTYDASKEPSIFAGSLGKSILQTFAVMGKRFTFGGEVPRDQRVYYFNTKELTGNHYGTPSPIPFRVVNDKIGMDMSVDVCCHGDYSYRICDPMLFYKNVCGNIVEDFTRDKIDSQMKSELITALQPALGKISEMGIRYHAISSHTIELADALNEVMSEKWRSLRGLEVVSIGVVAKFDEEDAAEIKKQERQATYRDPAMAAAHLVSAQATSMENASKNKFGTMAGFMGLNMSQQAGGFNTNQLFQMAQQNSAQAAANAPAAAAVGVTASAAPAADSWKCECGATVSGNFCPQCGAKKPEPKPAADSWTCSCGATVTGNFCPQCGSKRPEEKPAGWTCTKCGSVNKGKFCTECGAKKPVGAPLYRCDKCGWEPEDPKNPPKFCPQCGDPFTDDDIK